MSEKPIHYEPHPVSAARKKELVASGVRIVDAIYAPKEAPVAKDPEQGAESEVDKLSAEELKAALTAKGIAFRGNASKASLIELLKGAAA